MKTSTENEPQTVDQIRSLPPCNMNLKEAAAYLGVSERLVWGETAKRRIRVARMGRRLIFQRTELDRYISTLTACAA